MKKLFFLLILFTCFLSAQNSDRRVYLDSDFKEISGTNGSYYRIIEDEDREKELYQFKIFYKSGKLYMEGATLSKVTLSEFGLITLYYENGNKKEEYVHGKGSIVGDKTAWYENGIKKYIKSYSKLPRDLLPTIKILQFWDANNIQKVIDGNGYFDDEDRDSFEKGLLQSGIKTGTWEGFDKRNKVTYQEDYENGHLIKGSSTDSLSVSYHYTEIMISAKPRKGFEHFYKYIGKKFRFTKETEGKTGKIFLTFIIEKDGTASEIKILRSGGEALDREASRLIYEYPEWQPGIYRGKTSRMLFSIPITIR